MLFRKKIQRSCSYCAYGVKLDDETVLCSRKGMKGVNDQCWHFRYDPTKRIPVKPKALDFQQYDEDDFSL